MTTSSGSQRLPFGCLFAGFLIAIMVIGCALTLMGAMGGTGRPLAYSGLKVGDGAKPMVDTLGQGAELQNETHYTFEDNRVCVFGDCSGGQQVQIVNSAELVQVQATYKTQAECTDAGGTWEVYTTQSFEDPGKTESKGTCSIMAPQPIQVIATVVPASQLQAGGSPSGVQFGNPATANTPTFAPQVSLAGGSMNTIVFGLLAALGLLIFLKSRSGTARKSS